MTTAVPISLVVITLNEEKNIERCLKSVPFAQDIVVVDSGSQDRTVEIAQKLGARVIQQPWLGFSKQKTFAAQQARHDWVLSLDADEALDEKALEKILQLSKDDFSQFDGFEFYRRNFHLGRWLKYGGQYPDRQIRLFHRLKAQWTNVEVHERIEAPKAKALKVDILHWPFPNGVRDQVSTLNRYSDLRAVDFAKKGKTFAVVKMLLKSVSKFIELYFLKRGFLDGVPGLIVALVSTFATFLRWVKLYELQNLKSKTDSK